MPAYSCIWCRRAFSEQTGGIVMCNACSTIQVQGAADSAPLIKMVCATCKKPFQASASMAGKSFRCTQCNRPITVPTHLGGK